MKLKFNRRELILVSALLAVLAIVGHIVISDLLTARGERIQEEHHQLKLKLVDSQTLLEERDAWLEKRNWIQSHQPRFVSDEEAEKELLQVATSAENRALQVERRELLEIQREANSVEAGMNLQVTGKLEDLLNWLHQIQNPKQFREIRKLSLTPDPANVAKVTCRLTLIRHYRDST